MKLNNKHNLFIETYLTNGYNGTNAYLTAYPKASYETAKCNANKLLSKTDIKQLIADKKKELANVCIVTKTEIAIVMLAIMNDCNSKPNEKIKAGEVLNKMYGHFAPIEQTISLNVEQPLFKDLDE